MRGKENKERKEKEEEDSCCVKQRDVRVTYCSNQPLLELEYKKICFATNDVNLSLPSVDVFLMQEFEEEFLETVNNTMANIRG